MKDISLCSDHQQAKWTAVPAGCPTCTRINIERDIVTRVIDALLAAGYFLQTDQSSGGEEPAPALPTRDRAALLPEMMEVDDEFLMVFRPEDVNADGSHVNPDDHRPWAWVRFVYGNDGYDVMSDWITSLDPALKEVLAYVDTLS